MWNCVNSLLSSGLSARDALAGRSAVVVNRPWQHFAVRVFFPRGFVLPAAGFKIEKNTEKEELQI